MSVRPYAGTSSTTGRSPTRCGSRTPASRSCSLPTKTPSSRPSKRWRTLSPGFCGPRSGPNFWRRAWRPPGAPLTWQPCSIAAESTDFTTVLAAQQALLKEQDSLAGVVGDISSNLVGVYRALGGGWQLREGQEFVPADTKAEMAKRTNWGRLLTPAAFTPPPPGEKRPLIRPPDW